MAASAMPATLMASPDPPVPTDVSAIQSPLELKHIVFKASIYFLSPDINPAMPAMVFLSAARRPMLGFFVIVIYGREFTTWPISAWYDYTTGPDHLLGVIFRDPAGTSLGYDLFFPSDGNMIDFMRSIRSIQAGDYLHMVDKALPPEPRPESRKPPAMKYPAPAQHSEAQELPELPSAVPSALASDQPIVDTSQDKEPTSFTEADDGAAAAEESPASDNFPSENTALPTLGDTWAQGSSMPGSSVLIDFEAEDAGVVASQHPSEAAELLSTLESLDADSDGNKVISHAPQDDASDGFGSTMTPASLSSETIIAVCRSLLQVFLFHDRREITRHELDQTVEGIKSGVMTHFMAQAESQGQSPQNVQGIKKIINEAFDSVALRRSIKVKDRIRYTAEEMMSMRHGAIKPPACLADIPYLPQPSNRSRTASMASTHSRPTPERKSSLTSVVGSQTGVSQSLHLQKSANAMQWVLGQDSSPEAEPEGSPAAAPSSTVTAVPRDEGLQKSRWASGKEEVKHANHFTGPAYEKAWTKQGYLKELAQLDPHAKVTAGNEDLINFYFPSVKDKAPTNWEEPGLVRRSDSTAKTSHGGKTDDMETLSFDLSRLPIKSPQTMRSQPVQQPVPTQPVQPAETSGPAESPAAQPRFRGLAASRHSAGTGPESSGNFNFYVPKGSLK